MIRFHRILKKEKLKDEKRLLETLQKDDPESFLEKITQWERDRVQERMSLRHRGGTKFAKRQMIYAKFDNKVLCGGMVVVEFVLQIILLLSLTKGGGMKNWSCLSEIITARND